VLLSKKVQVKYMDRWLYHGNAFEEMLNYIAETGLILVLEQRATAKKTNAN
jgi:hypothetical protein